MAVIDISPDQYGFVNTRNSTPTRPQNSERIVTSAIVDSVESRPRNKNNSDRATFSADALALLRTHQTHKYEHDGKPRSIDVNNSEPRDTSNDDRVLKSSRKAIATYQAIAALGN